MRGLEIQAGRLLRKSASGVLAALRGSPYSGEYDSLLRLLRPCWTAFLNSLPAHDLRELGLCRRTLRGAALVAGFRAEIVDQLLDTVGR